MLTESQTFVRLNRFAPSQGRYSSIIEYLCLFQADAKNARPQPHNKASLRVSTSWLSVGNMRERQACVFTPQFEG